MNIARISVFFPLWAILFSIFAFWRPETLSGLKSWIVPLLSLVMFSMGLTLQWKNFAGILKQPAIIALAVTTQFLLMPLAAFAISNWFGLDSEQSAGMLLVGASAGGTASNVICYLARGNVALSVLLTTVSTLTAVIATPWLTYLYLGETVPVPVMKMVSSVGQIVLLPVAAGLLLNSRLHQQIDRIRFLLPEISSAAIILIIGIIVASNAATLETVAPLLLLAVILHNLSGLLAGYSVCRLLGYDRCTARTVSIEVGMQNSGLSVALAVTHFSTLTALPGALFSIWHNLSGAVLASVWRRSSPE